MAVQRIHGWFAKDKDPSDELRSTIQWFFIWKFTFAIFCAVISITDGLDCLNFFCDFLNRIGPRLMIGFLFFSTRCETHDP